MLSSIIVLKLMLMKFVIYQKLLDHVKQLCPVTFLIPKLEDVNCLFMVAVKEIKTISNQLLNVIKSVPG